MSAVAIDNPAPGIARAAILVASLDEATAELLLGQLDPACAELVRQAAMEIGEVSPHQRQRIMEDFRRIQRMVPSECAGGIDLDAPADLARLSLSPRGCADDVKGDSPIFADTKIGTVPGDAGTTAEEAAPFGFLREAEEEKLARLLTTERPQAIALVLSHLPPHQAGAVLAQLAAPLQTEVVCRLLELEKADPETLRGVEQALEARLSRLFTNEKNRPAGRDTVASILAACNGVVAATILDNVAAQDERLAERLGRQPFDFDDLVKFDDAALLAVFRAAEPAVAQTALLGAAPQLVERILGRMMPREAKSLRRKLQQPEPIRLSDLDSARRQIAEIARQKLYERSRPAAA